MQILQWLLPPVVGAIIGYSTNWLAIKMLFRPHNPIFVGKWRLPFTPGAIPSRRDDLAQKIGETVTTYLVNEAELHRVLLEPRVEEELAAALKVEWQNWCAREESLEQLLRERQPQLGERLTAYAAELLTQVAVVQMGNPQLRQQLVQGLAWFLNWVYCKPLPAERAQALASSLKQVLRDLHSNPLVREQLQLLLADTLSKGMHTISQSELSLRACFAIDEEGSSSLLSGLRYLEPQLIAAVQSFLHQESLLDELTQLIIEWVSRQPLIGFLGSFVSRERWEGLVQRLLQESSLYLEQPEHQAILGRELKNWLQAHLDEPLSLWLSYVDEEQLAHFLNTASTRLLAVYDQEESREWLVHFVRSRVHGLEESSLQSIISPWQGEPDFNHVAELLWSSVERTLQETASRGIIAENLQKVLQVAMSQPISASLGAVSLPDSAFAMASGLLLEAGVSSLQPLLKTLDISGMVQRRLSEFPVAEVEAITLSIAGRELQVITNLGALLGGLIGLSQLLLLRFVM